MLIIGTLAMENAEKIKKPKIYHFREQKNRIYVIYTLNFDYFLITWKRY